MLVISEVPRHERQPEGKRRGGKLLTGTADDALVQRHQKQMRREGYWLIRVRLGMVRVVVRRVVGRGHSTMLRPLVPSSLLTNRACL